MNLVSHEFLPKDDAAFERRFSQRAESAQPAIVAERNTVYATSTALSKPSFGTLLLGILVLITGLAIIYVADLNRQLNIELQTAQSAQNQLRVDWGKLLLEETTWSTQERIQALAQGRLGMQNPNIKQIVMISTSPTPILASRD